MALLREEDIEAEKSLIHSEFQKNVYQDDLREQMIFYMFSGYEESFNKFHHGNGETLKDIKSSDLLEHFKKFYSATNMKLAVYSRLDIETVEELIEKCFSSIPSFEVVKAVHICKKVSGLCVDIKPIISLKNLRLVFELPELNQFYRSKVDGELPNDFSKLPIITKSDLNTKPKNYLPDPLILPRSN